MKSVLICEGQTDATLLQYYLRKALQWNDVKDRQKQNHAIKSGTGSSRLLEKNGNELTITASGGSSKIPETMRLVLERIRAASASLEEIYDRIVIITDRDDKLAETNMICQIKSCLAEVNAAIDLRGQQWCSCSIETKLGFTVPIEVLVLVIPYEGEGAIETFLLNAIAAASPYDKQIIDECVRLVENVDPEKRYLVKRRDIVKAKYDVYFSIRTPVNQFAERQKMLYDIPWEQYDKINDGFQQLAELG
ncbi:MAG: DUF3226 domain-containing protein [Clostridia bacterium]|nr:DUF3226 domain-containing protein [Clostridia bacterium]